MGKKQSSFTWRSIKGDFIAYTFITVNVPIMRMVYYYPLCKKNPDFGFVKNQNWQDCLERKISFKNLRMEKIKNQNCVNSMKDSLFKYKNTLLTQRFLLFVIFTSPNSSYFKNPGHTPASVLYESSPPPRHVHDHPIKTNNSSVIRHLQQIMAMTLSK